MTPLPGTANDKAKLFTRKDIITTTCISLAYLFLSLLIVGFKPDQLFLVALFNVLFYVSFATRHLITGFSIFIVYWVVFDFMKAIPNYNYNSVNIGELYLAEKHLFGIANHQLTITPNEYFYIYRQPWLDVVCGIFYLCWVPVPLVFAAYLFYTKRVQFIYFALTFFLVNLLGFVVYYLYPAAPPWYVQQHGFHFIANTPGNTAGLSRFDALTGTSIFASLYQKSSNVFAAMPSLHSAYPLIVLYYGFKTKAGWLNIIFAVVMGGIWFAAVYTSHHYILDVLAGIVCAFAGIFIFNKVLLKDKRFNRFVTTFLGKMQHRQERDFDAT